MWPVLFFLKEMSVTLSSLPGKFKRSLLNVFFSPDGITPNSGLTRPNNTIYIYIYICMYVCMYVFKISSQCPRTVGVDYSLDRIYEENHINLWECSMYGYC